MQVPAFFLQTVGFGLFTTGGADSVAGSGGGGGGEDEDGPADAVQRAQSSCSKCLP